MGKGSGGNRKSSSSKPAAVSGGATKLGGGKGTLSGNTFPSDAKISQFEGETFGSGGYYSLMTKDGYSMVIETSNGYIEEMGTTGTLVSCYVQKGTGELNWLANVAVDGSPVRLSGGVNSYTNDSAVATKINNVMPYWAELANKWKAKN